MGYWVFASQEINLTVRGTCLATLNLTKGWNLVALPTTRSMAVTEVLRTYGGDAIYTYVEGTGEWTYYIKDVGGTLTELVPGKGYWVYIDPPGEGSPEDDLKKTNSPACTRPSHEASGTLSLLFLYASVSSLCGLLVASGRFMISRSRRNWRERSLCEESRGRLQLAKDHGGASKIGRHDVPH